MTPLKFDEGYRTNDEARHVAAEIECEDKSEERDEALNLIVQ
ncbi:hypothetical protein FOCG_09809 [Fusarium oxysporum f. sp. radicis-lycopersici 26381]|uniref:Uncharacterized protein n=2 Tax=Fusarium oxysporum TaxID=5507 RepID=W9L197_FUSOX|nr:hypothetical protein FOZG_01014 [Fusarium oxysporum Fo47]EWZ92013.1 hypothetical protein FOWG_07318 [Fusarium oxysporum f. sp. lycopersici MN25]EXA53274.1 hypothetical protein FOVG_01175 [Fusarium oxysporum f. sp. pisi HDV247]EXL49453.1 hypothetical protein FOCG_09809 [Fusarium oxysporum f. sp. radicis-lycopersici 26381]